MLINKVILYDNYCEIYFNTNGDKSKQLKLKEQPDVDSEILFESRKKKQSKLKSSGCSLMAEEEGFVLVFCKATLVSNFYALQKPSGSR